MAQVRQRDSDTNQQGSVRSVRALSMRLRERLPEWVGHWELWLALLLGGWLRLLALDHTTWLDDQTQLLDLARTAVLRGMVPATGIPASVGTLNPPISIYLLLPIAAFTANPLPQTILLALCNVAGVAICYVAALHGFGRRVAMWSALFFAVCPGPVWYGRFLWQQNFIAPLLGLWALTLFAAVKASGRRWFAANIILLTVCIQLHPTVAFLIPVTLAALWLSSHRPKPLEYVLAAVGTLFLLAPTLLWEAQSNWSDLGVLTRSSQAGAHYDFEVATALFGLLGAPSPQSLGAGTLFDRLTPLFNVFTALTVALFILGWLRLTMRVWSGLHAAWSPRPASATAWRERAAWAGSIAGDVRRDETWRLAFVLWLWVTLPLVVEVRHTITIFPHYLIALYPAVFFVIGLGADWIFARARSAMRATRANQQRADGATTLQVGLRAAPIALLLALLGGLAFQSTVHTTSVTSAEYSVIEGYGYPLNTMLGAVDALNTLQRREGIANIDIIAAAPPPGYFNDLATLLRAEKPTRSMMDGACLRLPGTGESLVVAEKASVPAAQLLATLPDATKVGALPLRAGAPAQVYRVKPLTGALPGETGVNGVTFGANGQPALRLEGYQRVAPNLMRLRWTALTSDASVRPLLMYQIQVVNGMSGQGNLKQRATCGAVRWSAGDTLVTWAPIDPAKSGPLILQARAEREDYSTFRAMGLTWFAGRLGIISSTRLGPPGGIYRLPGA